jgi:hypothetical protein
MGQPADPRTGSRTASGATHAHLMSRINNGNRKANLALAMAGGATVVDWAAKNGVAERTAYTWARSREVIDQVEALRRDLLDRAVNRLSGQATDAAEEIARLAREATSESVRLQAARAVLSELMAVSGFAALERRMAEIERRLPGGCSSAAGAPDPRHEMAGPDADVDPDDAPVAAQPSGQAGG